MEQELVVNILAPSNTPDPRGPELPSRRELRAALHQLLAGLARRDREIAVIKTNLIGFKDVNTCFGHDAGDEVLRILGARLAGLQAAGWFVAHTGGDTFACFSILPERPGSTRNERVEAAVAEVQERLTESVIVAGGVVAISARLGIVVATVRECASADGLLHDAEIAMYSAQGKQGGYALFTESLGVTASHRLTDIAELRSAIERRQLFVQYQPVVDMGTGQARSVEALVRWRHPTRGAIGPGGFIGLAESSGLISDVTALVVEQALADALTWRAAGHRLRCAVNLSVTSLTNPRTADRLVELFEGTGELLTVEVTESVMADDRAVAVLERLRVGGVQCAIDDFGTGYSCLATLKTLPAAVIKLDRALLADITVDPRDAAVVKAVVQLAGALNLTVIAEGMEDEETARLLRDAGITYGQGYHFARPMDAGALLGWLAAGGDRPRML